MLMHTREGTTIVTQQEKLKTKPDNRWTIYFKGSALFDPFCCLESDGQFSFSHRTSQVEPSQLLLDTFSKSSILAWKNWQQTASWSFSWSFSPATTDFQNSPLSAFYMARDLSSRVRCSPDRFTTKKSLSHSVRNWLNSIPRWFQWFFRSFVIF